MEQRKQRTLAIFALALALIATSVAYAALSTTLTISGNVTKKGGSWSVYISNVSNIKTSGSAVMSTNPTVSGSSTTSLNFAATLIKPGDKVEFDFTVANAGSVDAKISDSAAVIFKTSLGAYTASDVASVNANDITCKVTYNGSVISLGNKSALTLTKKTGSTPTTKTLHASCEYNDVSKISSEDTTFTFSLELPYVQA